MKYIADLHIHSPYSRATSPDSSPAGLAAWARVKGIQVIGTGDCTHPGWFGCLKEQLEPAEPGLFRLKDEVALPVVVPDLVQLPPQQPVRFLLSAEISSIYKRGGATRKVHNLLYLPDFESAERLNTKLAGVGNIASDGRPILGLDSRDLLEILLDCSPEAFLVPAHIWTPWFSLFGSKSGFDSLEECFGDLSNQIFALETGLSSDPGMNRLISGLDQYALISNSDCHSPSKLGREANLFSTEFDFFSLRDALKQNNRATFNGTIEFFPEEGKYHFDGHRDCNVCLDPHDSRRLNNYCPVCGKPLTIGVHHRVLELADRTIPYYPEHAPGFHSLIPLPELLGELLQTGSASKKVNYQYGRAIARFGSELDLLLHVDPAELTAYEPLLSEAVCRMREGKVIRKPGYDGEYGVIRVFEEGELSRLAGQNELFATTRQPAGSRSVRANVAPLATIRSTKLPVPTGEQPVRQAENYEQRAAIEAHGNRILVAAGPGTGKTYTLVSRLRTLLEQGADPRSIVAITFTNRTANELRERLHAHCGAAAEQLFIGTFHSFCLMHLRRDNPALSVVGPESRHRLIKRLFSTLGSAGRSAIAAAISAHCLGIRQAYVDEVKKYTDELVRLNALDLDAVIPVCVQLMQADQHFRQQVQEGTRYLFVDEFQDLNRSQYELVQILAEQASVFAIGDPDQAIYGFRGGDVRHFFQFAEVPGTVLLPLKTSYRLPKRIVQAASALICRNLICSGLPLLTTQTAPEGSISFYQASSAAAEAEFIVSKIEALIGGVDSYSHATGRGGNSEETRPYSFADIAILFRLGRQAEELADALARRGIPYQLVGATPFYCEKRLQPLFYLLMTAAGSEDISNWLQLFGSRPGIGPATLDRLESELPLTGNFHRLAASLIESESVATTLRDLCVIVERFHATATNEGVAVALQWAAPIVPLALDDDLRRLVMLAQSFGKDLQSFAEHLQQYAVATVYDSRAEAVALMSCHSAKGLEFPVVFIAGLEEGMFPCTLMGTPNIEEERRLLYVALTRAKEQVVLTASRQRNWVGQTLREPSRFMHELPAKLLDKVESVPRTVRKTATKVEQMELF